MMIFQYRLLLPFAALMVFSCKDKPAKEITLEPSVVNVSVTALSDYDFSKLQVIKLKKKLKEISGIAYVSENQFAAIEDETGIIFIINYTTGEIINSIEFAGKGDFEDVTLDDSYYYVLESSGIIYRVPRTGNTPVTNYLMPGKKKREFESIYFDEKRENIVMLCKECKHEDDIKEAFCFNIKSLQFAKPPCFSLDFTGLEKTLPPGTLLKPSAAAINPVDKKLYVLCSVGKMLLRCSQDGKIEKTIPLDQPVFRQPEGIAFTPRGDMFISNEAAGEQATLVRIGHGG